MIAQLCSRVCLIVLLLMLPAVSLAGGLTDLKQDFAPIDGVVVMPVSGEFLVDLDATRGLAVGDLLAVVEPGEPIVHPVSGEMLGRVEQVKGLLQVTRVKTGYSYARPVGKTGQLIKGDKIRRFANVRSAFWDYDGAGETFFANLKQALPDLDWQNYATAQSSRPAQPKPLPGGDPPLVFILREGNLQVRGASFEVIRSYPDVAQGAVAVKPSPEKQQSVAPAPVEVAPQAAPIETPAVAPAIVPAAPAQQPATGGIVVKEQNAKQGVWDLRKMRGDAVGVEVAELDGDGQLETAILFRDHLEVGRYHEGQYQGIDRFELPSFAKGIALDAVDLDGDGKAELYLSVVKDFKAESLAVALSGGILQVRQKNIPFLMHRLIMPDGEKLLLGQQLEGGSRIYSSSIFRLENVGGRVTSSGRFQYPWRSTLFGLQPFQLDESGLKFANLGTDQVLQVLLPNGDIVWESSQEFGGTTVGFDIVDNPGGASYATEQVLIKPRIEPGPDGLLLVPQNDGKSFTSLLSNFGPSRLVAMRWQDGRLQEEWKTTDQEGGMVDFRLADVDNDGVDELAIAVIDSTPGAMSKGQARVVVFELP